MYQLTFLLTRFSTTAKRALVIRHPFLAFGARTAACGMWPWYANRKNLQKVLGRRQLEVSQLAVRAKPAQRRGGVPSRSGTPLVRFRQWQRPTYRRTCRQGRLEPATRPAVWLCSRRRLPAFEGCACVQAALSRRTDPGRDDNQCQSQRRSSRASGEYPPRPRPRPRPSPARCTHTAPVRAPSSPFALGRTVDVPARFLGCGAAYPGTAYHWHPGPAGQGGSSLSSRIRAPPHCAWTEHSHLARGRDALLEGLAWRQRPWHSSCHPAADSDS